MNVNMPKPCDFCGRKQGEVGINGAAVSFNTSNIKGLTRCDACNEVCQRASANRLKIMDKLSGVPIGSPRWGKFFEGRKK